MIVVAKRTRRTSDGFRWLLELRYRNMDPFEPSILLPVGETQFQDYEAGDHLTFTIRKVAT